MWKIEKQVHDAAGLHRWQSAGSQRFATRQDAAEALKPTLALEMKRGAACEPRPYSVRLRVALAAVAACLALQ